MRFRLYFMLPDLASARRTADDLLLSRIEDRHMHFLAREGTDLGDLHEASFLQKTDIRHGAAVGLTAGAILGALLGLALIYFPGAAMPVAPAAVLLTSIFGALFGVWASSMVATAIPNSHLARFARDIESGRILLMLDLPSGRMEEIRALVKRTHPECEAHGREPTIPAFP